MDRRTQILNQIAEIDSLLANPGFLKTTSYSYDSGQGKQATTYRSLRELRDLKDDLEHELGEIDGTGVITLDLVRPI